MQKKIMKLGWMGFLFLIGLANPAKGSFDCPCQMTCYVCLPENADHVCGTAAAPYKGFSCLLTETSAEWMTSCNDLSRGPDGIPFAPSLPTAPESGIPAGVTCWKDCTSDAGLFWATDQCSGYSTTGSLSTVNRQTGAAVVLKAGNTNALVLKNAFTPGAVIPPLAAPALTAAQLTAIDQATQARISSLKNYMVMIDNQIRSVGDTTPVSFGSVTQNSWKKVVFAVTNTSTATRTITVTVPSGFHFMLPAPLFKGVSSISIPPPSPSPAPTPSSNPSGVFSAGDSSWATRWTGTKTTNFTLAAGATVTVPIYFGGISVGANTGTLTFTDSTTVYTVPLTGMVVPTNAKLQVSYQNGTRSIVLVRGRESSFLQLGVITTVSKTFTFIIKNVGGTTAPLVAQTLPAGVTFGVAPPASLSPNQTATVTLVIAKTSSARELTLKLLNDTPTTNAFELVLTWSVQ